MLYDSSNNSKSQSEYTTESENIQTDVPEFNPSMFNPSELMYFKSTYNFIRSLNRQEQKKIVNIIQMTSNISLRLLDWFINEYCRTHSLFVVQENICSEPFSKQKEKKYIYINYKANLKAYGKKYFDPFRRYIKFRIILADEDVIVTIGQLNFFKWAYKYDIINYVEKNYNVLITEMKKSNKDKKKKKIEEPTLVEQRKVSIADIPVSKKIVINFD